MNLPLEAIFFYVTAAVLLFFAYKTITSANPVHSALYLALTMIGLAGVFYKLNAQFIAGVQLIVYAGAVMVLFVMVIMLFDLQSELKAFSKGMFSGLAKIISAALLAGFLIGAAEESRTITSAATLGQGTGDLTKNLALLLFSKYLFAFEILGVMLLVIAVAVVALSRVRGGTHAKH